MTKTSDTRTFQRERESREIRERERGLGRAKFIPVERRNINSDDNDNNRS